MKQPTKLKNMKLTSVDLVKRGANQDADIKLFKNYDGVPDEDETQGFFKNLTNSIADAVRKAFSPNDSTDEGEILFDVTKSQDDLSSMTSILDESFNSILTDSVLKSEEKTEMLHKSLSEFTETVGGYITSLGSVNKSHDIDTINQNTQSKGENETMRNLTMEDVDKSLLSPEETVQLDALLEKACKTKKADGMEDDIPNEDDVVEPTKSGDKKKAVVPKEGEEEMNPEVKKALEEVATLKKSIAMKEMMDVAKKYTVLGKKEEEVAKTLFDMKEQNESVYKAYVEALDAQVELVEKSGMFAEIGKSGQGYVGYGSVTKSESESKIEVAAAEIRKSDPNMSYEMSVAKAWESNPELMAAYEDSYNK